MTSQLKPLQWVCLLADCGANLGPVPPGEVAMAYARHFYDEHPTRMDDVQRTLVGCECKPYEDDSRGRLARCPQCRSRIARFAQQHSIGAAARHFGCSRLTAAKALRQRP